LGTAITRAGREGYWPASSAGIARDAHASSSVACADFPAGKLCSSPRQTRTQRKASAKS